MNTTKKWTAFSVYIFFVVVVFLYILFPSETVKNYVGYRLGALMPQAAFEIDRLRLGIPPGLSFQDVEVNYREKPAVKFDQVVVTPDYWSLLTANATADFSAQIDGGTINGRTIIDSASGALGGEIIFSGVDLKNLPILDTLATLNISGKSAGEINYLPADKSTAILTLTNCKVDLNQPIMGIHQLIFDSIDADAEMQGRQVNIQRIDFKGPQASGSGKGTLVLRQPIESSRINLSGTLKPHPSIMQSVGALIPRSLLKDGGIPIRITGTLGQPNLAVR